MSTQSSNLLHAVYGTACRVMGLGKKMFIHFPHGAEGEAELIACDFELVGDLAEYVGHSVFAAPELNMFITLGGMQTIPHDVREAAIEDARVQCRACLNSDNGGLQPAP